MKGTEREREAETQAEGEAGSPQGARCGTQSQEDTLGLGPELEADVQLLSHPGAQNVFLKDILQISPRPTGIDLGSQLWIIDNDQALVGHFPKDQENGHICAKESKFSYCLTPIFFRLHRGLPFIL